MAHLQPASAETSSSALRRILSDPLGCFGLLLVTLLVAAALGAPLSKVRPITYCLKKMGLIVQTAKKGNTLLFQVAAE